MKFSVNWLREFVELPDDVDGLVDLLTMAGVEIEAVEKRGANFDNVIVGQITHSKQHPNADRLTVCTVNDGSGVARQIVCGAKNYNVGDKVPLALPGAKLPDGSKIGASKLRGVESQGMLCSAKELRLGDDGSGLLILATEAQVGAPLADVFPADTILNVEITPNRGDLLSHIGLAREIAALEDRMLHTAVRVPAALVQSGMIISAPRECLFYSARRIENVKVTAGPQWMRTKIDNVGIRSINNIVDVANYVMLESGQPLHAFDADKLRGTVNVRFARDGEQFLALDGRTYSLSQTNLVIADAERAIAIAGVIGGEDTAVSEQTTNILLESAYFLPSSVRRTARQLNLSTDSSYRFERRVDPQATLPASERASELIGLIAGGKADPAAGVAGELPPDPADVALRYERATQLLGIDVKSETADDILQRFGLSKRGESGNRSMSTVWKIPSYRSDLQREVDLIEEIVRAFGVEKIPDASRSRFVQVTPADRAYDVDTDLRRDLIAAGLSEIRTSSLIGRSEVADVRDALHLRNPVSEDHVALRTSLVPGLLKTLARNARAGAERIAVFEVGDNFAPNARQTLHAGVALCGRISSEKSWRAEKSRAYDFFDLKGIIELIASRHSGEPAEHKLVFRRMEDGRFPLAAEILLYGARVGICGQLSTAEAKVLDAPAPVFVTEIGLRALTAAKLRTKSFREIERYPAATRDIAMFVPVNVTHADILAAIASTDEPLLERAELFDLFTEEGGETDQQSRKSLAYSLTYRAKNRTLTSEEVNAAHARIRDRLRNQTGAQLRE